MGWNMKRGKEHRSASPTYLGLAFHLGRLVRVACANVEGEEETATCIAHPPPFESERASNAQHIYTSSVRARLLSTYIASSRYDRVRNVERTPRTFVIPLVRLEHHLEVEQLVLPLRKPSRIDRGIVDHHVRDAR